MHPSSSTIDNTLTAAEYMTAHTITNNSFDIANTNFYALGDTLKTDGHMYIAGNLVVDGAITPSGFSDTGLGTIPTGETLITVAHAMGNTPSVIAITWTSDSGGKRWWVPGRTAAQFTFVIDSVYSQTITFLWGVS